MKIDINSIDREQFAVDLRNLNGEDVYLIQPLTMATKWTKQNKIFRSLLVNADGDIISAGFPKFVDFGVQPDVFPPPKDLNHSVVVTKEDGSLLIVSKYRGQWIFRTRGTVDATEHGTGAEIDFFKETVLKKLLKTFALDESTDRSFLFEWLTPANQIVVKPKEEPELILIGCVNHEDYSLSSQISLDEIADFYGFNRPKRHFFDNLDELLVEVEKWQGLEGVCLYTDKGQSIHRIKSSWYKNLFNFKRELSSFESLLDVWLQYGRPDYVDFYNTIANTFDYHLAEFCKGNISIICDAYKEAKLIVAHMKEFVLKLAGKSRKDQALAILAAYGKTERSSFVFNLLDGKEIDDRMWKKLIYQITKK